MWPKQPPLTHRQYFPAPLIFFQISLSGSLFSSSLSLSLSLSLSFSYSLSFSHSLSFSIFLYFYLFLCFWFFFFIKNLVLFSFYEIPCIALHLASCRSLHIFVLYCCAVALLRLRVALRFRARGHISAIILCWQSTTTTHTSMVLHLWHTWRILVLLLSIM